MSLQNLDIFYSVLTEQELKHNQENRWRCSLPCTLLLTGQACKGAKKTAKGCGALWGVETVSGLLQVAASMNWGFLGSWFTQLEDLEHILIRSPYQNLLTYSHYGWFRLVFKYLNFKSSLNHKRKIHYVLSTEKTGIWFSGVSNLIKSSLL